MKSKSSTATMRLAFYRRFYTPNNAIVVVAGDVTADEVKADAEETYGKVRRRAPRSIRGCGRPSRCRKRRARSRLRIPASSSRACRAITWRRPKPRPSRARAKRSKYWLMCSAPARIAGSIARWWSTRASRFDAGAYYSGTALDYGKFGFYGTPKPGVSLHQLEDGIDAVLDDVIAARHHRRRTRPRQEPADRRCRLCAGQSGDAGALVRLGARNRPDRRYGARLARPHPRRDGRCRATGRAHLARPPPVGDGLSRQKSAVPR